MLKRIALMTVVLCLGGVGAAHAEPFPRPAALEPQVRFWVRVYTEVGTDGGFIHDSRDLGIVYDTVRFPEGASSRRRQRILERAKSQIRSALETLASGRRSRLGRTEKRVLALFPDNVSDRTLAAAARRVRFQLGQANKFREGLLRSGRWEGFIGDVLAARGVPGELAALPHVESSYNPKAYSHAGAAGLWQFTRSTGRLFMRIDHVIDERYDPYLASDAAARLLVANYKQVQSWPLAITGYNHGIAGMRRAVRKLGTRDIATIVEKYRSRSFGFASRNFYTSFLAALQVDQDPERYFGPIERDPPAALESVQMDSYYAVATLENAFGVSGPLLRALNPALLDPVWSGQKYVPKGYALRLPPRDDGRPQRLQLAQIPASERILEQRPDVRYRVRRGDTLSAIAARYGVSERELVALNGLRSRHRIRIGQVLRLPSQAAPDTVAVARAEARRSLAPPAGGRYVVHRGDNLTVIAKQFGVDPDELARLNGIRHRDRIYVGQSLRIPGSEESTMARKELAPAPAQVAAEPAARTASASPPTEGQAIRALPPEPVRFAVRGQRIEVHPGETLGHIAEWLEVRASDLRRLNGIPYGRALAIGQTLRLDFRSVAPSVFEQRRLDYHRALREQFFESFEIAGTGHHVLRRGESLWELSRARYGVPVWLLREFNQDLDLNSLQPGTRLTIPRVARRSGGEA